MNQGLLFGGSNAEERNLKKKQTALEKEIQKMDSQIEKIRLNKTFIEAFEWRFGLPEVLDNEGEFVGFDAVIGKTPIRQ